MDYDKTNHKIDEVVNDLESKTINVFNSNLNFIRNLRKYITNEYEQFESIIVTKAIKISAIIIVVEALITLLGYKSLLGIVPKLITIVLLFIYLSTSKSRRK